MKWVVLALLASATGAIARPETAAERLQIRAAEEAARDDLRGQVLATSVGNSTIRTMIDQAPGSTAVETAVDAAEQIGGPRWGDGSTCQIKLRLSGEKVAAAVAELDQHGDVRGLAGRTFVATGTSIPAGQVAAFVPSEFPPAWQAVSDADRSAAVLRARDAAVVTVVERCGALPPVTPAPTTAESEAGRGALTNLVGTFPVTRVSFRDDRQVEVALFVDRTGLLTQLMTRRPAADTAAARLIDGLPQLIVGRAKLDDAATAPAAPARIALPARMPAWLRDPITADATAPFQQSKLRTARAAENDAVKALRARMEALPLDATHTLGQAAAADDRYRAALDRAAGRARPFKVDYRGDGSVAVSVTVDPNELWDLIAREQ